MAHPLDDPRAKLRRAKKHLNEFDLERKTWYESSPYVVLPYASSDKTEWVFRVHRLDTEAKPEDDVWGLIIGDYVHALRSALDQLAWKLVTIAGRKRKLSPAEEKLIAFPIISTHPTDFWSLLTVKCLKLEQALMLEGFQPYRAIGMEKTTPLADLHALWNSDKHRLITPIKVSLSKTESPVFEVNEHARIVGEPEWNSEVSLKGDADIATLKVEVIGSDPKVEMQRFTVDVTFGENDRAVENLPVLLDMTTHIVENCTHFFQQ